MEALRLTNEFRAQHKLPALAWHQTLCEIAYVHSKDMGDGKVRSCSLVLTRRLVSTWPSGSSQVPFDHVGFKERVAK